MFSKIRNVIRVEHKTVHVLKVHVYVHTCIEGTCIRTCIEGTCIRTCNFVCCHLSGCTYVCMYCVCVFFLSTGQNSGNCTEEQPAVEPIGNLGVCACVSMCMCV